MVTNSTRGLVWSLTEVVAQLDALVVVVRAELDALERLRAGDRPVFTIRESEVRDATPVFDDELAGVWDGDRCTAFDWETRREMELRRDQLRTEWLTLTSLLRLHPEGDRQA